MSFLDNVEHQAKHLVHRVSELKEVDQVTVSGVTETMPNSVAHVVNKVLDVLPEVAKDEVKSGLVKWTLSMEYVDPADADADSWNGFSVSMLCPKPE